MAKNKREQAMGGDAENVMKNTRGGLNGPLQTIGERVLCLRVDLFPDVVKLHPDLSGGSPGHGLR